MRLLKILGYEDPSRALRRHIDPEDKFQRGGGGSNQPPLYRHAWGKQKAVLANESSFYSSYRQNLNQLKKFKMGYKCCASTYQKMWLLQTIHNQNNNMFKIENETDLHFKVVQYISHFYRDAIIIDGLGENQDTAAKGIAITIKSAESNWRCVNGINKMDIDFSFPMITMRLSPI